MNNNVYDCYSSTPWLSANIFINNTELGWVSFLVNIGADVVVFSIAGNGAPSQLTIVSTIQKILSDKLLDVWYIKEGNYIRIKFSMKEQNTYPVRIICLRTDISIVRHEFVDN